MGCSRPDASLPNDSNTPSSKMHEPKDADIVARVNGRPIYGDEVVHLVRDVKSAITPKEALEVLIRNALLADEAKRRGFGENPEAALVRKDETARALLKLKVEDAVTLDNIDPARLRRYFDEHKSEYIHGPMRRTVHFLARCGTGFLSEEEALHAAQTALSAVTGVQSGLEFREKLQPLVSQSNKKLIVEELPPFEENSRQFLSPFVEATFKIPKVGDMSPFTRTTFGIHIIYLDEEISALNRPFKEVKSEIAALLLPGIRRERSQKLLNELFSSKGVFVYDDALRKTSGDSAPGASSSNNPSSGNTPRSNAE